MQEASRGGVVVTSVDTNPRVRVVTIDPSDDKDNKLVTPPVVTIERVRGDGTDATWRARTSDGRSVEFEHSDDGFTLQLLAEAFITLAIAEEVS